MTQNAIVRRLRPYLFTSFRRYQSSSAPIRRHIIETNAEKEEEEEERRVTNDYDRRFKQLLSVAPAETWYPRLRESKAKRTPISVLQGTYKHLRPEETDEAKIYTTTGRIHSIRALGSKLIFVTLIQDGHDIQGLINLSKLSEPTTFASDGSDIALQEAFHAFASTARKGDIYSLTGHAHRTTRGELSISCTDLPELLAPSLHQVPPDIDAETRARKRHVDMLVSPSVVQVMKTRHTIEKSITSFLNGRGFTGVHTPILTSSAGGAVARPFVTRATEFADQGLSLRIAPELWLKRLVVGGLDKVYELGPAFRNEGVDATHNPEFYMCEFYEAYATLEDLMATTERLLARIATDLADKLPSELKSEGLIKRIQFKAPFKRLEFVPALEEALGRSLPDLASATAETEIKEIFREKDLWVPVNPSLSRLLDALASHYLEPLSQGEPLFIIHHPAALSPLSKHFVCPKTQQTVAARAELFIKGWEVANMYEEENSPFEQRRKFLAQHRPAPYTPGLSGPAHSQPEPEHAPSRHSAPQAAKASLAEAEEEAEAEAQASHPSSSQYAPFFRAEGEPKRGETSDRYERPPQPSAEEVGEEEAMPLDEAYLEALEWGLPPTGGWGCGVDRLVMLFTGRNRIGEVLAFGGLRNVVAAGRGRGRG